MSLTLNSKALAYLKGLKTKDEIEIFLEGLGMAQDLEPEERKEGRKEAERAASPPSTLPSTLPPAKEARNRGLQADILRLLYTGPCSLRTLQAELSSHRSVILTALRRLAMTNMISETKSAGIDVYHLTALGAARAKYFVENPNAKLYAGGKQGE